MMDPIASFLHRFVQLEQENRQKLISLYGEDFESKVQIDGIEMTKAEAGAIQSWYEALKPRILEKQKLNGASEFVEEGEIYYGATGGGLTYSFTPTGLGTILVVKEAITGEELNVSDAVFWYFYG